MKNQPTGVRGHGMDEARYPQDGLQGRNVNRRQVDIQRVECPIGDAFKQGTLKLRPGLWRLIPVWPTDESGNVIPLVIWFRVNESITYETANLPPSKGQAEPITWVMAFREVFLDGDATIHYSIPRSSILVCVLLSELDEP